MTEIRKRSGELVPFQPEKITCAIFKAATAVGGKDWELAKRLTDQVVALAEQELDGREADVETLAAVPSMNRAAAERVWKFFH